MFTSPLNMPTASSGTVPLASVNISSSPLSSWGWNITEIVWEGSMPGRIAPEKCSIKSSCTFCLVLLPHRPSLKGVVPDPLLECGRRDYFQLHRNLWMDTSGISFVHCREVGTPLGGCFCKFLYIRVSFIRGSTKSRPHNIMCITEMTYPREAISWLSHVVTLQAGLDISKAGSKKLTHVVHCSSILTQILKWLH